MIDEAPILRVRRNFPRPPADLLAQFAGVPAGFIVDAMGGSGCLDYRIKPLVPSDRPMLGVAMTCHAGPSDNLALIGALEAAQAGDILVAATENFTGAAITGDLVLGMARNRGVVGFVTDGLVRDLVGVLGVGLPVYCAGLTANSPARSGPGTVGLPVILGGLRTATLQVVATATVAAYASLGGLGRYLIDGIKVRQFHIALVGALLVTVLALLLDGLLALAVWASVPGTGRIGGSLPQPLLDDEVLLESGGRPPGRGDSSHTVEGW